MPAPYILALDQGTTSSRAILFDSEQNILAVRQHELAQHYPQAGWVEQDPMDIWSTQYAAMLETLAAADVPAGEVAACGTGPPAARSRPPSSGSAAAPPRSWTSWCGRGFPITSAAPPA